MTSFRVYRSLFYGALLAGALTAGCALMPQVGAALRMTRAAGPFAIDGTTLRWWSFTGPGSIEIVYQPKLPSVLMNLAMDGGTDSGIFDEFPGWVPRDRRPNEVYPGQLFGTTLAASALPCDPTTFQRIEQAFASGPLVEWDRWSIRTVGLPWLCLELHACYPGPIPRSQVSSSALTNPSLTALPLGDRMRLRTLPAAGNVLFLATTFLLIGCSLERVRRVARRRRGLCAACGFPLRCPGSQRCPECGDPRCDLMFSLLSPCHDPHLEEPAHLHPEQSRRATDLNAFPKSSRGGVENQTLPPFF